MVLQVINNKASFKNMLKWSLFPNDNCKTQQGHCNDVREYQVSTVWCQVLVMFVMNVDTCAVQWQCDMTYRHSSLLPGFWGHRWRLRHHSIIWRQTALPQSVTFIFSWINILSPTQLFYKRWFPYINIIHENNKGHNSWK